MPSNKLPPQLDGDMLAALFHAARRSPVRIAHRQLQRAGIVPPNRDAARGIPYSVLVRARENSCVVWGPYLTNDGEPYYIIEGRK